MSNMSNEIIEKKVWRSFETKETKISESKKGLSTSSFKGLSLSEFPESIQKWLDSSLKKNIDRKKFFKIMGASLTMATVSCVRKRVEKIVPYVSRPENTIPGKSIYYTTTFHDAQNVLPVLVKTIDGKPIKIEPQDKHPLTKNALNAYGFATIWDLYDPDRLRAPRIKIDSTFVDISWSHLQDKISPILEKSSKIAILSRPSFSPSEKSILKEFTQKYKNSKHIVYDHLGDLHEIQMGNLNSYGHSLVPHYHIDKADLVLSVEADFLGSWLSSVYYTKSYSKRRTPGKNMQKVIAIEAILSLTGSNADERYSLKQGASGTLLLGLANLLLDKSSYKYNQEIAQLVKKYTPQHVSQITQVHSADLEYLAKLLWKHRGRSLVLSGGLRTRSKMAGANQVIVNLLNSLLKNEGNTISYNTPFYGQDETTATANELVALAKQLEKGAIDTLIINGSNPVFDIPNLLDWDSILSNKVDNIIYIGSHNNETSKYADILISKSHQYETWSDSYAHGVYSISQPVISNLYDTKSQGDIWYFLSNINSSLKEQKDGFYNFLKYFSKRYTRSTSWFNLLKKGFVYSNRSVVGGARPFRKSSLSKVKPSLKRSKDMTLSLYTKVGMLDGAGANNSFRQELPDPITKATWGNYFLVSPQDAKENNWKTNQVATITLNEKTLTLPIFVQPGVTKYSIAVAVGYGHTCVGQVANGVGKNILSLIDLKSNLKFGAVPVSFVVSSKKDRIATTQLHNAIDDTIDPAGIQKRVAHLARSVELSHLNLWLKEKKKEERKHELQHGKGLYTPHKDYKEGLRWGMAIDLNKCIGCSACVMSCYSENNIPAVGKEEVLAGSEMAWIRIDRYYTGSEDNPQTLFQPLLCQHCENAPCETVCPVVATTHTSEGLNHMAYNRCIGTRYCANNCPFKVRRFNWFENWEGKTQDPLQYSLNPNVTVRSRGVIEKCSFCIQRISEKRIQAKLEDREIQDGEVRTACQQGCPTEAITFGNVNDEKSKVVKLKKDGRSYRILDELNVKSSIHYMAKVINNTVS